MQEVKRVLFASQEHCFYEPLLCRAANLQFSSIGDSALLDHGILKLASVQLTVTI